MTRRSLRLRYANSPSQLPRIINESIWSLRSTVARAKDGHRINWVRDRETAICLYTESETLRK